MFEINVGQQQQQEQRKRIKTKQGKVQNKLTPVPVKHLFPLTAALTCFTAWEHDVSGVNPDVWSFK